MAAKGIFYVFALVKDLEVSKKFYGETLGWDLRTDEGNVAGFAFGSAYLVIHSGATGTPAQHRNGDMHVTVHVEDVNAEHTRLKGLGVEVTDLADWPWGERNFQFSDPDGYLWLYGQATRGA